MNHYLRLTVVFIVVLLFSLLTSCTQPSKPAPKPPTEPITPTPNLPVPEITVVQTLFGHKSNIGDNYSISSNGTIAIQKGLYIHLIDGYTGELKHTIAEKDDIEVFSGDIIFSPDGNLMINNHSAGASVWDINSYKLLYTLDKQISTFSDDGKLLDNTFYAETGEHLLASFDSIAYYDYITNTLKYSNLVHGPIFSPDRSIFAHIWTVQGTSTIEVRQTNDYQLLQTFPDNSIQNWESPFLEISNDNEILLTNHTSSPYSENPTAVANIWQISDAQLLDSYTRNFSNKSKD